jgi:glycosyltransferase involved in cell wall biosynthesis
MNILHSILPAIVIVTYNRPHSLIRILESIQQGMYPENDTISLIISIDGGSSNNKTIVEIAESFQWNYGSKKIIAHEKNFGLKKHILACGDLSYEYGAVIVLEDDIVVSPGFYLYAQSIGEFYKDDEKINQVSLYSYKIVEYVNVPFYPLSTGDDVYFLQSGSSWGQLWTNQQWRRFRIWLSENESLVCMEDIEIPEYVKQWPNDSSWKKWYNIFLVETDTYSVVPYQSYSSNVGDDGIHHKNIGNLLQVPLAYSGNKFRLPLIKDSICVYDAFFEMETRRFTRIISCHISDILGDGKEIVSDFYGLKRFNKNKKRLLVFTSQPVRQKIVSYGDRLLQPLFNILYLLEGDSYSLAYSDNVVPGIKNKMIINQKKRIIMNCLMDYSWLFLFSTVISLLFSRLKYKIHSCLHIVFRKKA